jgi:hypothetical protein
MGNANRLTHFQSQSGQYFEIEYRQDILVATWLSLLPPCLTKLYYTLPVNEKTETDGMAFNLSRNMVMRYTTLLLYLNPGICGDHGNGILCFSASLPTGTRRFEQSISILHKSF